MILGLNEVQVGMEGIDVIEVLKGRQEVVSLMVVMLV